MRNPPTVAEVAAVFLDVLAGRKSRAEAGAWARQWMVEPLPVFPDDRLFDALDCLAAADRQTADGASLFTDDDFGLNPTSVIPGAR